MIRFLVLFISIQAHAQFALQWVNEMSAPQEEPPMPSAFTRQNKTVMFSSGTGVYHVTSPSMPIKSYTTNPISCAWFDGALLACLEGCMIVNRDFNTGSVKSQTCLTLLYDTPTLPFSFMAQSGNYYYGAYGKWLGKFDKKGFRIDSAELSQAAASIEGIALGGNKIFISTYNVSGSSFLVYDLNLKPIKSQNEIEFFKLQADKHANCYLLTQRQGYSIIMKKDSLLNTVWTAKIMDAHLTHLYLKGDSLFATGSMSSYAAGFSTSAGAFAILDPTTGSVIEKTFVDISADPGWMEELVEIESDGENIYASGFRRHELTVPFVLKMARQGVTAIQTQAADDLKIYASGNKIVLTGINPALPSEVFVRDVLGRIVFHQVTNNKNGELVIDAAAWTSGCYTVDLRSNQTNLRKKVVLAGQ